MSVQQVHRTSCAVEVNAPAGVVYALIADTTKWPLLLPTSVHVERLDFDGRRDRFHTWVRADGGGVRSWFSNRTLDAPGLRVDFRQEGPAAPVAELAGSWIVEPLGAGRSRLALFQEFTVAGGRAADAARVRQAAEAEGRAGLDALKAAAERWPRFDGLLLSFEDSVRVNGPADLVYQFLYDVGDWQDRVPHVVRADVVETAPGVQLLAMDSLTADGAVHTTESVRVCFPAAGRIVYKQTATPALMAAHTGEWSLIPDETGVTAVSQHTVLLREEAVERILGPGADLTTARRHVREALGRNSTATLGLAKRYAETAIRTLAA
ncbi:aromatase/cyclase [Streptomyces bambusae]|uniref:aromatase/cyclase n=1 Tax=Streptomyces bambusae TaxID=1550616 RepID=UPI001CFDE23B|nr:aromatase/cyclase [Streptomyces bambusae]MCB5165717.1 aromatase/cyclase [Streptomyces bambusae]